MALIGYARVSSVLYKEPHTRPYSLGKILSNFAIVG